MSARVLLAIATLAAVGCRPAPSATPEPPASSTAEAPPPTPEPAPQTAPEPAAKPESEPAPPAPLATERWSAGTVPPLSDEDREVFWGSAEDPAPEVLGGIVKELEDVHYTIGNEWALQAFYEDIKDLGGGYVGVGPDQAYLFVGWQRPHLAWFIDYDAAVLRTHALYKAVFAASETPAQFLRMFDPENLQKANAAIDAMYDGRDARALKALLRRQRRYYRFRLRRLVKRMGGVDVPTYLNDQETFDYVKAMLAADRIRPLRINLNEAEGMAGIGEAARALEVPIRVLYVSNAEEYWERYDPQFIANVEQLYSDDDSVLLRTRLTWKINKDYMYIVQPIDMFRQWLTADGVTRVRHVLAGHPPTKSDELNHWVHDQPPPADSVE